MDVHKEIMSMIKEVHALYILAKLSGEPKNPEGPQRPMVSKTSQTEAKETARNVFCKEHKPQRFYWETIINRIY